MIHQDPLVSIIIPTFNRAHLIGETLDSVLAQTYQNWECIVVDDGRSYDRFEFVSKYVETDNRINLFRDPKTNKKTLMTVISKIIGFSLMGMTEIIDTYGKGIIK